MTPEEESDKLDAKLKEDKAAMAKLQSTVAETKEASEELEKSLEKLEAFTKKAEEKKG